MPGKRHILIRSQRLRRKKALLKFFAFFAVFFLFFAVALVVFNLPALKVKKINVNFSDRELSSQVLAEIETAIKKRKIAVFPLDNILLFPKEVLERDILKKHPKIKKINFDISFPDAVSAEAVERKPEAVWCESAGECFFADNEAVIFGKALFVSEDLLKIMVEDARSVSGLSPDGRLGGSIFDRSEFEKILKFKESLKNYLKINPTEIFLKKDGIYEIVFNPDWRVIFDSKTDTEKSFENFKTVFEEKLRGKESGLEYVDLRFGRKIFFKFK